MERVGFILKVKQEKIPEYKKHHEAVWPEMQEALRKTGWHNYTLFIRDDGLVFGYFEAAESFQASRDAMAKEPINLKWQQFMAPYFEGLGGSRPDETLLVLEEYFHIDFKQQATTWGSGRGKGSTVNRGREAQALVRTGETGTFDSARWDTALHRTIAGAAKRGQ